MEDHGLPLHGRQGGERPGRSHCLLVLVRSLAAVIAFEIEPVGVDVREREESPPESPAAPPAMDREQDCEEPGSEPPLVAELKEFLEGPQHGLLVQIVAFRRGSTESPGGGQGLYVEGRQEPEEALPAFSVRWFFHPFARERADLGVPGRRRSRTGPGSQKSAAPGRKAENAAARRPLGLRAERRLNHPRTPPGWGGRAGERA